MFAYAFMQRAFIAGIVVAALCGLLGVFVVLRRTALIGDALAHTAFGGIAVGVFAGILPLQSALAAAVAGAFALHEMKRRKVFGDLAVAIMYSAGLAGGVVLLSLSGGLNVDVLAFLFGSILTVSWADVWLAAGLCAICGVAIVVLLPEFAILTLNDEEARTSGVPAGAVDLGLTLLVAVTVVMSMRLVGVLLVASLLAVPAATALQLRLGLRQTIAASAALAVLAAVAGIVLSFVYSTATGGTIVLVSLALFLMVAGLSAPASGRRGRRAPA
jgi:zinc transport system permease protein